jgi:glutamine amidotransferase-like uncharacterized protein
MRNCVFVLLAASASLFACSGSSSTDSANADLTGSGTVSKTTLRPLALIYRGDKQAGCEGCSEAVGALLQSSRFNFEIEYVGPKEARDVEDASLEQATLYAQPAGNASVSDGWDYVKKTAPAIRNFVQHGGRYIGFCMGGYFAGSGPGFDMLPGNTDEWITTKHASITSDKDGIVSVDWRGTTRFMYFQDGPYFIIDKDKAAAAGAVVLATYSSNDKIAAMVAPYGSGKVGVSGPHPEADASWYRLAKLKDPDGLDADLGRDLLEETMK